MTMILLRHFNLPGQTALNGAWHVCAATEHSYHNRVLQKKRFRFLVPDGFQKLQKNNPAPFLIY